MNHPTPWRVGYRQIFPEWHPKSLPTIYDAQGYIVLKMDQSEDINHPGIYDRKADTLAHRIVAAVNAHKKNPHDLCGQGGCATLALCPKHQVPMISTITDKTLCAVCEYAEKERLKETIAWMEKKELHGCAGFNCAICDNDV